MLENELWGNTIENWGISILIILGAIIIVKLLSLLGKKVIKPFVTGTDNHLDDVIFYSLEAPVKFAIFCWESGSLSIGWFIRTVL